MAWKATGRPTVRAQRARWVVRVDGIDTETGQRRPRQLGTFPSQRAARQAAAEAISSGDEGGGSVTVAELLDLWVESRTDIGPNQRQQYRWAATHVKRGLGAIQLDQLQRADIARWLRELGDSGGLSRRSIQIARMTLRAVLNSAVDEGELRRNPAANVPVPKNVGRAPKAKVIEAWDEEQLARFLAATADHRWAGTLRLQALYGLRRSEALALRWDDIALDAHTVNIDKGLVEADGQMVWSDGKNRRSRRQIQIDPDTARALARQHANQLVERAYAGALWDGQDLVAATHTGGPVQPRNYSHTLDRLIEKGGLPRLTTHGLRHTAATHMVASAADLGEVRAAADLLGHSPEMLMKTYSHALPASIRSVTAKIAERSARSGPEPGPPASEG